MEGLPEEFALLRWELAQITDNRFSRGRVYPLEDVLSLAALGLMCGQCSLGAIYRLRDSLPELLSGLGLLRSQAVATLSRLFRMVKVSEVRRATLTLMVALSVVRRCR